MRKSIGIVVTSLLLCAAWTAFGAGDEMSPRTLGADPNNARVLSSDENARLQYNYGVRAVEKADGIDANAARQKDPRKKAKLAAKAAEEYHSALQRFLKATGYDSGMYEAWNYAGYCSRKLGRMDDALLAHDRALSIKPGFPEAIESRAHAYLALDRLSEAKEAYLALNSGNRKLAQQLLAAMQAWVRDHRADPAGVDAAMIDSFASWVGARS